MLDTIKTNALAILGVMLALAVISGASGVLYWKNAAEKSQLAFEAAKAQLQTAQANLRSCGLANEAHVAAERRQNEQIDALKAAGDALQAQAQAAQAAAHKASGKALKLAQRLKDFPEPLGDSCKAERAVVDEFYRGKS